MRHGHLGELSLPVGSKVRFGYSLPLPCSLNIEAPQGRDQSKDQGGVLTFAAKLKGHF